MIIIEVLKMLSETPLPLVLVIGGLVFLFVSFFHRVKIQNVDFELSSARRSFSDPFLTGIFLLLFGICLYILPALFSRSNTVANVASVSTEQPKALSTITHEINDQNQSAETSTVAITQDLDTSSENAPSIPTPEPSPLSQQEPVRACQEAGGASGFSLTQTPVVPPTGCVLMIEWYVPPNSDNCGLIITTDNPVIPEGAIGVWWHVYPQRPEIHQQAYLEKYPQCKVEDLR